MTILIFILILLGIVLNKISYKYCHYNLFYKREFSKKVVEIGEEISLNSILENKKILPVTFVRISEKFPNAFEYENKSNIIESTDGIFHTSTMSIMPFQRIKRTYSLKCSKRGAYSFSEVSLTAGDFLGVTTSNKEMSLNEEIVVLPKTYQIEKNLIPYGNLSGDISVKRWIVEDPILMVGVTEYTGREPQKWIHWPTSLRQGRLMVKKFDYTSDNKAMILLNIESFKPFWMSIDEEGIEKCISIVRGVAEGFEDAKIPYGFINNGQILNKSSYGFGSDYIYPGTGENHLYSILECLGRINYSIIMTFEEMVEKILKVDIRFTTLVLITPEVLEPYAEYIDMLKEHTQKLILITLKTENLHMVKSNIDIYIERSDESGYDYTNKSSQ
ncbi:MAG TPA: hypothetical protein DEF85_04205 [Clostridiaceae bacterium]|jgi:uncharacterized protein (DUF58 family)|nr:hypothetical protein [Clostridiaceae bacterium]HBF78191.1 hypothetical protein [Clostridiaceae bacterium]HBG37748.1 hypothetical protein [Clostridiaceae bacterium]HBN29296.1 hypothetical protein [Clostridiaceae bacterium]HBX48076.1 hypothetical protein [Clostridiaceae bacterium]